MKNVLKWIEIVLGSLVGRMLVAGDLVVFAVAAETATVYRVTKSTLP